MAKARQAKPEKDQAATEIANEEETRAASVADGEEEWPLPTPEGETTLGEAEVLDILESALRELGVPGEDTPAPIFNAVNLIAQAQEALRAGGVEVVGTLERAEEVELFSPGEVCPTSGLWRPTGSESALSKGDRFPPPSIATGWMLMEAAEQRGRGS